MKKSTVRGILAFAVIAAMFNLMAFVIPFIKTSTFWVAYAFGLIALLLQPVVFFFTCKKGDNVRSKFYGFPVLRISAIYFCAQTALSLFAMAIAGFTPVWIIALIFAFLLLLTLLGLIGVDIVHNEIVRQDDKLVKDVTKMRSICSLGMALPAQCTDAELKKALESFAEHLRFADPVSNPALADIENELETLTGELQRAITDGDIIGAKEICKRAEAALMERNRLCKLNK